jgi:hypothetical protein
MNRFSATALSVAACLVLLSILHFHVQAQAQSNPRSPDPLAAENGGIKITVPAGAFKDRYWVYLDEALISAPPYADQSKWNTVPTPDGTEIYSRGGLTAVVDEDARIQYVNAALASIYHFYRVHNLSVRPGTHTVEVLISPGLGPDLNSGFPFLITGKDLTVRRGQITEYAPNLPKGWNSVSAYAARAMAACLDPSTDPPDDGKIQRAVEWYKAIPVVKPLRTAAPSYISGGRRVVRLELPLDLGGTREFDDSQIQTTVNLLKKMVDDKFPQPDPKVDCDRTFPEFLAKYKQVRDLVISELNGFRRLAKDGN